MTPINTLLSNVLNMSITKDRATQDSILHITTRSSPVSLKCVWWYILLYSSPVARICHLISNLTALCTVSNSSGISLVSSPVNIYLWIVVSYCCHTWLNTSLSLSFSPLLATLRQTLYVPSPEYLFQLNVNVDGDFCVTIYHLGCLRN